MRALFHIKRLLIKLSIAPRSNYTDLFIYYQTANDGRPRPEQVIGNAKVNKNGSHIHPHPKNTNRKHGRW